MARLLGIDIGTSGTKALLVDEAGKVLKKAEHGYPLSTPQVGWAEQDPEDWWLAVQRCLEDIGGSPDAIGLTGQMHGSVFLDASGGVVRPALLWCDQRTVKECEEITNRVGKSRLLDITCNPMLTGFQLPKVVWLRGNEPGLFSTVRHVLLPKDYVAFRLTGALATDCSDASGVGALDVAKRTWSSKVFEAMGLDASMFPTVVESWTVVGKTPSGVPVVIGAGDQAAGAVGVGAVVPGVVSVSLGTSGVAFTSIDVPKHDRSGSVHVFCHATGGWHAMGVMLSCGGALTWSRNALFSDLSFQELDQLASTAPAGSDGVLFLSYLAGERCPVVDPGAKGAFVGLSLRHGREHLARAVMEGVSFGIADCVAALTTFGDRPSRIRVTGGGAKSGFWTQMVADVLDVPCVTLVQDEGPAFGAALLAGVGISVWDSVQAAADSTIVEKQVCLPSGTDYSAGYLRYQGLYYKLKG